MVRKTPVKAKTFGHASMSVAAQARRMAARGFQVKTHWDGTQFVLTATLPLQNGEVPNPQVA